MAQHWHDLLPVDRYRVVVNGLLYEYDRKTITLLYQPLIGTQCLSLYMTLWAEVEENRLWSTSNSHHSLMNFMNCGLKEIYEARLKLEGIGLLKTYVKKEDDNRSFIYELQPPLTPKNYFLDGLLNVYLYRKIGKAQYNRLKRFFSDEKVPDGSEYELVTKGFQDIFMSNHQGKMIDNEELNEAEHLPTNQVYIGRQEQQAIKIADTSFDFELLFVGIHESLLSRKAFTKKVKEAIQTLSFLYGIDPIQMKNIVISAINEKDEIDIEELRISARDWYQFQHNDLLPKLVDLTQPVADQMGVEEPPKTKEEELFYYLDHTSPRQLLKDIAGGIEPSKVDLQIIEEIMFTQKLSPGVVNVLIQYVMLKTDMKLTKGYMEKIASQWVRKNVRTVKEAIDLAKKEHKQYVEWAEGKKTPTANRKTSGRAIRTEKIPEWFGQETSENESNRMKDQKPEKVDNEFLRKKQELEEKIKNLRK